jgi:hypothetical protein
MSSQEPTASEEPALSQGSSCDATDASPASPASTQSPTQPEQGDKDTNTNDIDILNSYLSCQGAPASMRCAVARIAQRLYPDASQTTTQTLSALNTIQSTIQEIADKISTPAIASQQGKSASYASAVRQALGGQQGPIWPPTTMQAILDVKPVPSQHKREITVTRGEETSAELAQSNKEIIEQLNAVASSGEAVALRRLPSGDILLTLDNEETRNNWLQETNWTRVLGMGAKIKRRTFVVIAHGIHVSQVQAPADAVRDIYQQNPGLRGSVEILQVAWQKWLLRLGRPTGPLQISVAEPEQANILIESGLIWGHQIHKCEPYEGDCQITQCFKCYRYGHIAKMCRNTQRCGFCAAPGHNTNECLQKEDLMKHWCVPCEKHGHCSWSRDCPIRKEQIKQAKEAYSTWPAFFQDRTNSGTDGRYAFGMHRGRVSPQAEQIGGTEPSPGGPSTPTSPAVSTTPTSSLPKRGVDIPGNEWTEVRTKRARISQRTRAGSELPTRGPGRPRGSTRAARHTVDIRQFASTQ